MVNMMHENNCNLDWKVQEEEFWELIRMEHHRRKPFHTYTTDKKKLIEIKLEEIGEKRLTSRGIPLVGSIRVEHDIKLIRKHSQKVSQKTLSFLFLFFFSQEVNSKYSPLVGP